MLLSGVLLGLRKKGGSLIGLFRGASLLGRLWNLMFCSRLAGLRP